jgi:hypothetical protein
MELLTLAADAIRRSLRRAMLALTQPEHSPSTVPTEYYRFPLF